MNRRHRHKLACMLSAAAWIVCVAEVRAQSLPALFAEGNAAFFRGDFATSIARYEALLDSGVNDADVYYNLGTAYARAGQCGRAILHLERSLRHEASDPAVENNLHACQTQLGKRRAQTQGEATVQTRPPLSDAMLRSFSVDGLAWLALGLNVLLFACLLLRRAVRTDSLRLSLAMVAVVASVALVVTVAAVGVKADWLGDGRAAIVLDERVPVREGPDPRARARTEAHEGERARILSRDGDFVRVRLLRGPEGWMHRDDVGAI